MFNFLMRKRSSANKAFGSGTTHGLSSIPGREKIIDRLINDFKFKNAFDIGCGYGDFFHYLRSKNVHCEGAGCDVIEKEFIDDSFFKYIESDFLRLEHDKKYDLVFCSHVVEHVPDTGEFLNKLFSMVKPDGVFCIIWPPPKKHVVGGHVHVFNFGLMLYNIVRTGVDCSSVKLYRSGYNLAIMGKYAPCKLPNLTYNRHEIETLAPYFPCSVFQGFNGDLNKFSVKL